MADEPLKLKIELDREQSQSQAEAHINDERRMVEASKQAEAEKTIALKKAITAEEAMILAKNQRISKSNQDKVDEAVKQLKKEEFAHASLTGKMGMTITSLKGINAEYNVLGNLAWVGKALAQMWENQAKDIEASVDRVVNYKEKLLELAALKDKLGNPDPVLNEMLIFRSMTGQTAEQADKFQKGALNTGQSSVKGGFISQDEFDSLMRKTGEYQAASGADPTAIGELTGILPQMIGTQGQSADDVYRRMIGIFGTLQQGGADLGPAVRAFKENASLIGPGMVRAPEQLAAIQSMFSVKNVGKEGTLVDQLLRSTNLGQLRQTKTGAENSIVMSEYMKSLGINDQMDAAQVSVAIASDIIKAQDALKGKKNPDGTPTMLNIGQYLTKKGLEGTDMIKPMIEFAGGVISGQFEKTFGQRMTPESAPTIDEANAATAAWKSSDVKGRRTADLSKDISDTSKSSKAWIYYRDALRLAFNTMRADPNSGVTGEFEGYSDNNIFNPWSGKVLDKLKEMQFAAARKAGVAVPDDSNIHGKIEDYLGINAATRKFGMGGDSGYLGGSLDSRLFTSQKYRADTYYELSQQVRAKGGNPLDDSELIAELKKNTAEMQQNTAEMRKQGNANPPGQATPQVPSVVKPGPRQNITR